MFFRPHTCRAAVLFRFAALLGLVAPAMFSQSLYNRELVVNGDAEAGPAAPAANQKVSSVPGWTTTGPFNVLAYGTGLTNGDPGPRNRGKNYFIGGNDTPRSSASQLIALPGVDAGARFYLSACLGRNYGNNDPANASLTAEFMNSAGAVLYRAVINGPKNFTEYDIPGGLQMRALSGFLPPGVSQVKITLDFATPTGSSVNAYAADAVSLILTQEPLFSANLAVNGDAEADPAAGRPVTGWNGPTNSFKADPYDARDSDLTAATPGPGDRGRNYLYFNFGGDPGVERRASQAIDISDKYDKAAALIDAGRVTAQFAAWLGNWKDEPDKIYARATFLDASSQYLSSVSLGPITGADHGNQTALLQVQAGPTTLPRGTRRVLIELIASKVSGVTDNMSAYVDNLSFVLATPDVGLKLISVRNAATGVAGTAVSPGEMVTLSVSGLDLTGTTRMQLDPNNRLSPSLSGITVTFDATPAPLLYVSTSEIGAIVPFEVDGKGKVPVQFNYKGDRSAAVTLDVAPAVPGIFTQEAPGSANTAGEIWNEDWTLNSAANPAAKGSIATIFWTGGGQTDPPGVTGRIETGTLPRPLLPVAVTIGGQSAEVISAEAVPWSWAGLLMARIRIPDVSGSVPVVIIAGDASSPDGAATLSVQ